MELTPNSRDTGVTAEEYTEEPQDATRVSKPRTKQDISFRRMGQDFAFAGSLEDVNSTR